MGVCLHSQEAFWDSFVIFAVSDSKIVNQQFKAWALDHGILYKELYGCYKGQTETSYIVPKLFLEEIAVTGWLHEQESILELGPMQRQPDNPGYWARPAKLVFRDNQDADVDLGILIRTDAKTAFKQDAWSFDPMTNTYWITREVKS